MKCVPLLLLGLGLLGGCNLTPGADESCLSGSCESDLCQNGLKDPNETDVDCGGPCSATCGSGKQCNDAGDCESSNCSGGTCQAPSCSDGIINQEEHGIDCGGPCETECSLFRFELDEGHNSFAGVAILTDATAGLEWQFTYQKWVQDDENSGHYEEVVEVLYGGIVGHTFPDDIDGNIVGTLGPPAVLPLVQSLSLRENNLAGFPQGIEVLVNLENLYLDDTQMDEGSIPIELWQLSKLHTLSISRQGFLDLTGISNAQSLRVLNLSSSDLVQPIFPEISQLSNLEELNLTYTNLQTLPPEILTLTTLKALYVGSNSLTELPSELGNLSNLQTLDLSRNQLVALPPEIGNLSNLQHLNVDAYFRGTLLSSLPVEFGNLTSLKTLSLAYQGLTSLPAEFANLTNLETLNLYGNSLTVISTWFGSLVNLRELNLSGNSLTSLPSELGNLTNLETLNLSANYSLTAIPAWFGSFVKLRELDVSYNNLSSVSPSIVGLANLQVLNLAGNNLSDLPAEIGQLTNLRELYLNDNAIATIAPGVFGAALPIEEINLRDNGMTQALVDEVILQIYQARHSFLHLNTRDCTTPLVCQNQVILLRMMYGNASPSGMYASPPGNGVSNSDWQWDGQRYVPLTGQAMRYDLEHDVNEEGFQQWITFLL